MTETAAHLVDHVIPRVPVRQWVLTVPHRFRYRLGYDHELCKRFLRALTRELQAYYRSKTNAREGQIGSVTFIQRFNSSLALSPHFHVVATDGVFVDDVAHGLRFIAASEPAKLDVAELVSAIHARVHAELHRLRIEEHDHDSDDKLMADNPALAACYSGSVTRRAALGPNAGKAIVKLGANPHAPWVEHDKPRHGHYEGFDLHADVAIAADDRHGLEQLLRYCARSAVASDRLSLADDGRVVLTLRRPYHDGTSHLLFEPTTFIERLAALVPRPHKNLIVYSGVVAPNAKLRSQVVGYGCATQLTPAPVAAKESEELPKADEDDHEPAHPSSGKRPRPNYTWAQLMSRTFAIDVLACQHCGGRLKLLSAVMNPKAVRAILASLGLPTEAPQLRAARAPPAQFEWA